MDKDNVMLIEYNEDGMEMVAIFNKTKISEEEVKEQIINGNFNPNVIHMQKRQYLNVFYK